MKEGRKNEEKKKGRNIGNDGWEERKKGTFEMKERRRERKKQEKRSRKERKRLK